jgi:hypothetical protein
MMMFYYYVPSSNLIFPKIAINTWYIWFAGCWIYSWVIVVANKLDLGSIKDQTYQLPIPIVKKKIMNTNLAIADRILVSLKTLQDRILFALKTMVYYYVPSFYLGHSPNKTI